MQRLIPALALVLFASSAAAQNAPFCLVDATGTRCQYYSLPDCERDARVMQGGCVVNANRGGNQGSSGSDWFNNATRNYETGRQQPDSGATQATQPARSNLGPVVEQFCREMRDQDLAELDRLISEGHVDDNYERLFAMWSARSDRCFAIARAAR